MDYLAAESETMATGFHHRLRQGVDSLSSADLAAVNAAQVNPGRFVAHLRRGASKDTVSPRGEQFGDTQLSVATLVILASRKLSQEGRSRQAVEALLDLCQFSRDIADTYCGLVPMKWAFVELRAQMASGSFNPETAGLLETGLQTLDGSFPSPDPSHFRWARRFAADARTPGNGGVLVNFLMRDTYTTCSDISLSAIGAWKEGWLHERHVLRSLDLDVATSFNPRTRSGIIGVEGMGVSFRLMRVQLRLLRLGSRYLASGESLDLEDPFGGSLKTSVEGNSWKAWSAGEDAIDDGGSGKWDRGGKDIVLELRGR